MGIYRRILEQLVDDMPTGLASLSAGDLRTLLLHVFRTRAANRSLREVFRQYRHQALLRPSPIDARMMHAIEGEALASLPCSFSAIDFGAVGPLGAHHLLGGTPQDNLLTATRNAELVGDPTVMMALQLAATGGEGRLASRFRATRMQPLRTPGHTQHFSLFALASGGWSRPAEIFETEALCEHLIVHLGFLRRARARFDGPWRRTEVRLSDLQVNRRVAEEHGIDVAATPWPEAQAALRAAGVPDRSTSHLGPFTGLQAGGSTVLRYLHERVAPVLQERFPDVAVVYDFVRVRQTNYYTRLAFHITIDAVEGPIADGGFVDWGQRLLNNRKHRMMTSGVGTQLVADLCSFG